MFMLAKPIKSLSEVNLNRFIAERKYNGERSFLSFFTDIKLVNRREKDITQEFPELTEQIELKKEVENMILDGEIVIFRKGEKREDFSALKHRTTLSPISFNYYLKNEPVALYVFDIIWLNDKDLREISLLKRKEILKKLIVENDFIKLTPYTTDIETLFKKSKKENWEGIMLKDVNSRYIPSRSDKWLKLKNTKETIVDILGLEEGKDGLITSKGNIGLRSGELKAEYLKYLPKKAEVEYLYETKSGKLYQPILKRFIR